MDSLEKTIDVMICIAEATESNELSCTFFEIPAHPLPSSHQTKGPLLPTPRSNSSLCENCPPRIDCTVMICADISWHVYVCSRLLDPTVSDVFSDLPYLFYSSQVAYRTAISSGFLALPSERTVQDYTNWCYVHSGVHFIDQANKIISEKGISEDEKKFTVHSVRFCSLICH